MTPIEKNNEPLDAILRRTMRERPWPATPECADAESLAAYSDRSLATLERERLEAHFADCMRCQVMLADIARADESARSEKAASAVPWYRRRSFAIPALAAVAAVLVFITVRRPANEELRNDQLVALAKNEAPQSPVLAQAPALAPSVPAAPASPALLSSELAMNEQHRQALARSENSTMSRAAPAPAMAPAVPAAAPERQPAAAAVSAPPASASNEIAMNEAKTESAPRGSIAAFSSQSMQRDSTAPRARAMGALAGAAAPNASAQGYGVAASSSGAAIGAVVAGGAQPSSPEAASSAPMLMTISTPDRSVTWIVGKNGLVQRRDADGATRTQHSGVSTDLVAGSAPSATVCWIVGRSGTVIRTTDGEHWELVTAPSTDNLTSVSASSATDATVTTAGGQSFATSDGGATWHQQ